MNNIFKGLLAGYGAMKLGGGCWALLWFLQLSGLFLGNAANVIP